MHNTPPFASGLVTGNGGVDNVNFLVNFVQTNVQ